MDAREALQQLEREHQALLQFVYLAPVGLVQVRSDGEIVMLTTPRPEGRGFCNPSSFMLGLLLQARVVPRGRCSSLHSRRGRVPLRTRSMSTASFADLLYLSDCCWA